MSRHIQKVFIAFLKVVRLLNMSAKFQVLYSQKNMMRIILPTSSRDRGSIASKYVGGIRVN